MTSVRRCVLGLVRRALVVGLLTCLGCGRAAVTATSGSESSGSATEAATNAFGRFRSEGGLAEVKSFSVVSTQLVPGTDTVARAVEVTAEINGKTVRLRARHKQPLEWIR